MASEGFESIVEQVLVAGTSRWVAVVLGTVPEQKAPFRVARRLKQKKQNNFPVRANFYLRKRIIAPVKYESSVPTETWLDLEDLAAVEVTSEEPITDA